MNLKFITLILIAALSVGLLNAAPLEGIRIAILTADSTHDAELLLPYGFFMNQGAEVTLISDAQGKWIAITPTSPTTLKS